MAVGDVEKMPISFIYGDGLLRRTLIVAFVFLAGCETHEEKEQHERDKQLDRFYELEWVKCVNELGIERCEIIQETGFRQCQGYLYKQARGIQPCAEERFQDRMKVAVQDPTQRTEERGAPDVVKPEVEEKAP